MSSYLQWLVGTLVPRHVSPLVPAMIPSRSQLPFLPVPIYDPSRSQNWPFQWFVLCCVKLALSMVPSSPRKLALSMVRSSPCKRRGKGRDSRLVKSLVAQYRGQLTTRGPLTDRTRSQYVLTQYRSQVALEGHLTRSQYVLISTMAGRHSRSQTCVPSRSQLRSPLVPSYDPSRSQLRSPLVPSYDPLLVPSYDPFSFPAMIRSRSQNWPFQWFVLRRVSAGEAA